VFNLSNKSLTLFSDSKTDFFCSDWRDVYQLGLDFSYLYLANAIRSICQLPSEFRGIKIILVTPEADTVRWISTMLQYTAVQMDVTLMPLMDESDSFGQYSLCNSLQNFPKNSNRVDNLCMLG